MTDYQTFAVVEYHVLDPLYATPWGDARARDFYGVLDPGQFLPWFAYDGLFNAGFDADLYEPQLQQRLMVSTDVTLAVSGVEVTPDTYDITTEVCVESGGQGKVMRIYTVQVLDHYPPSEPYYRNSFIQAAPIEDVNVAAGECVQVERSFTFDATSTAQMEDIKIVSWAQEPLDVYPAEVHQAIESAWPFVDLTVFRDGFDSGDLTQWSGLNP